MFCFGRQADAPRALCHGDRISLPDCRGHQTVKDMELTPHSKTDFGSNLINKTQKGNSSAFQAVHIHFLKLKSHKWWFQFYFIFSVLFYFSVFLLDSHWLPLIFLYYVLRECGASCPTSHRWSLYTAMPPCMVCTGTVIELLKTVILHAY